MKILFTSLLLFSCIVSSSLAGKPAAGIDCSMAVTYSEMAFANFKKAYQSNSVEEAQPFIKKGVEQAAEASAYAINSNCNCAIAKNYALNAVTFGNKAAKADNLSDVRKFSKKAMNMSLDVMTAVPGCK